jgi:23S rRNA (adenine1618-N6)-methyltransferase
LAPFVLVNDFGKETIDFSDPKAVLELNRGLLYADYRLKYWEITRNSLCPAIPGRVDYIHYIADLLAEGHDGAVPTGNLINILDVGTGSSVIYPILGCQEYEWNFVGTDIDQGSLNIAQGNINKNSWLKKKIQLRLQEDKARILKGVVKKTDRFDAVMCNPPFFKSREDNWKSSTKKFANLHKGKEIPTVQNFRGLPNELWYPGGEKAFIRQLIYDSMDFKECLGWVTTLVSDKDHLKPLLAVLEYHKASDIRIIQTKQGNKTSRILAWYW